MAKSFAYYRARLREKVLHRLMAGRAPEGTRFALATYLPVMPETPMVGAAGAETAFVFQGPVAADFEATHRIYRALFPASPIVIATWETERSKLTWLDDPLSRAIFLIPPARRGIMNVNLQLWSAAHGIEAACTDFPQVQRIAKLRMDYPPRQPHLIFPIIDHFDRALPGLGRIWGIDINTIASLPFSFSDIFQIGPAAAMRAFWNLGGLDDREISPVQFLARTDNQTDIDALIRLRPAEIYLTLGYLARIGAEVDPLSIADYQACLASRFGILDADQIGLAFDKYTPFRNGRYVQTLNSKRFISFPEWLHLAMHAERKR